MFQPPVVERPVDATSACACARQRLHLPPLVADEQAGRAERGGERGDRPEARLRLGVRHARMREPAVRPSRTARSTNAPRTRREHRAQRLGREVRRLQHRARVLRRRPDVGDVLLLREVAPRTCRRRAARARSAAARRAARAVGGGAHLGVRAARGGSSDASCASRKPRIGSPPGEAEPRVGQRRRRGARTSTGARTRPPRAAGAPHENGPVGPDRRAAEALQLHLRAAGSGPSAPRRARRRSRRRCESSARPSGRAKLWRRAARLTVTP